jgi:hypothetical protein
MTVAFQPLKADGVQEALRTLNEIDKTYRRRLTVEYKTIVYPLVSEAQYLIPARAPMSGWNRSWTPRGGRENYGAQVFPWKQDAAKYVKPFLSGKRPRRVTGRSRSYIANATVMGVRLGYAPGTLFDMTHNYQTKQGAQMLQNLNARYGQPSRAMWRAYEQTGPDIQDEIRQLVNKILRSVNQKLKENP